MANNIGRIRIFGADIVVTTADHQASHSYLRAFKPVTISFGGGFLGDKYVQEDVRRGAKFSAIDDHVDTSSRLSILDDYDDDDVDTTLRLSTSVSTTFGPPVLCPMPLRCFPPGIVPTDADFWFGGYDVEIFATDQVGKTMSLSDAASRISGDEREKSRKRKQDRVGDEKKTRSVKRKRDSTSDDHQDLYPIDSLEDNIPGVLVQIIESRNGTSPVFLYRKRLEQTDVSGHHNRLFVNRREKFMEFLTDEEMAALNQSKQGLEVFAVDPQGKLYKLGLKIWQSLKVMVVNSDWNKLVVGNNAQKGDWIQIWGYREDEKLRFAINFRKSEA